MIRSQVVVLNVVYDDDYADAPKSEPAEWDWAQVVFTGVRNAVEVLAAGPLKGHPRPGEAE